MKQALTKKLFFTAFSAVLLGTNFSQAQNIIQGSVKTKQGVKIPYASISVKTTNVQAVADSNGNFTINTAKQPPLTIEISHAGFEKNKLTVAKLQDTPFEIVLTDDNILYEVLVTSRRRQEVAQDIPIPITVLGGTKVEESGAFNVNRLKELIPSVQLYASNARNTTLNIRGLGSTFGLTNDGIEPGVGFYIDGVYHARPAVTALDFSDIDRIEILRGPQGTLFGKNTTAGAFNVFTKKPTFTPSAKVELSYGNYNFIQAKASVSGGLTKNIAARVSFSGTQRQGTIFNDKSQQYFNGLNNVGIKGQILWQPTNNLDVLLSADYNEQSPDGSALVVAGVTKTQRSAYRQYDSIVKDLGYAYPTINPFARKVETDSWKHNQVVSGAHINVDYKLGKGTLTSTTAWRFWNWDPFNDRDFTAIPALTRSQGSSRHNQYSQEVRYAGNINSKTSTAVGVYYLYQNLATPIAQLEEVGPAQWRFVQTSNTGTQALYKTPGLLDNYGIKTDFDLKTTSAAVFGQVDWEFAKGFHILPGVRYNYDKKDLVYARTTYGGLQTTDATLLALKKAVYANQAFAAHTNNNNLSANITVSYRPSESINAYATYSNNYKSIGLNLGGLPTIPTSADTADLSLAEVKPEYVQHYEVGIKTRPFKGATLNVTAFNTDIKDYQTTVQVPQIGLNRGYLANAEKVRVQGIEVDARYQYNADFGVNAALAYTDAKYVSFINAPLPLEETGKTVGGQQVSFTDASGGVLPGVSKWNLSGGFDWSFTKGKFLNRTGKYFLAADASSRSGYSSNPTPSAVLNIDGYALLNSRIGFKSDNFSMFIWARNLTGTNYFEQLQAAAGNSGLYAGVLGDPRTYGVTLKFNFQ